MPYTHRPTTWTDEPPRSTAPRVLVEHHDGGIAFATERLLERHGYQVAVCSGPESSRRGQCALLDTGECDLVKHADVVVHGLNVDRIEHRRVLAAIRSKHPELPVVVEVAVPTAARHAQLLSGCVTMPLPTRRSTIEDALRQALREKEPAPDPPMPEDQSMS